jgi:integrase
MGNLTDKAVKAAKPKAKPFRLSDAGGLLLLVRPGGRKSWVVRLTRDGRRMDAAIGGYPELSLAEARERAIEARRLAKDGLDPTIERDRRRREAGEAQRAAEATEAEARSGTFRVMTERCVATLAPSWRSARTAEIWLGTFERWLFPVLGDVPVARIDRAAVARAMADVWVQAPGLAAKLLQRVGAVLRFAVGHGFKADPGAASMKGLLTDKRLPPLPGERGHPSLPWERMPALMRALEAEAGLGPLALRLVALTALRSAEIRNARWSWLDFTGAPRLTVPGEHMKGRKADRQTPHAVPLPPQALDVLAAAFTLGTGSAATRPDELPALAALMGDRLIFPGSGGRVMSDATLSAVLLRMNRDRPAGAPPPWRDRDGRAAVPHGLRASFSTWCDDSCPHEREAAERQLGHAVANRVSRAYRRSDLFERRVALMAAWADHCCSAPPATVATLPLAETRVRS